MLRILLSVGVVGVVLMVTVVASADPLTNSAPPVASVQGGGQAVSGSSVQTTNGVWTVVPDSYTYQWLRDGGEIAGATDPSYTLTDDDVGHSVLSAVTAISGPDSATEQSSNAINVGAPTTAGSPTISGTLTVGQTLTANPQLGSWGGVPQPTVKGYQWIRCTPACSNIAGATNPTFPLTAADVGATIKVSVTAGNGYGSDVTATSGATGTVSGTPTTAGSPTISGTLTVGQTLTANPQLGSWGGVPQPTVKGYQWIRCTPACSNIAGATNPTFPLTAADVGATIKVSVTAGNGNGSDVTATSGATGTVSGTPTTAGSPTISGTPTYDQVLTANENLASWGGVPQPTVKSYQWLRNDVAIAGATGKTYKLTVDDVGKAIKVSVTAGNGNGSDVTATSGATALVSGTPTTAGSPTISGTPTYDQVLTANENLASGVARRSRR